MGQWISICPAHGRSHVRCSAGTAVDVFFSKEAAAAPLTCQAIHDSRVRRSGVLGLQNFLFWSLLLKTNDYAYNKRTLYLTSIDLKKCREHPRYPVYKQPSGFSNQNRTRTGDVGSIGRCVRIHETTCNSASIEVYVRFVAVQLILIT